MGCPLSHVIPAALSTVIPAAPLPSFPRKRESRTVLPKDRRTAHQVLLDSRLRGNDGRGGAVMTVGAGAAVMTVEGAVGMAVIGPPPRI